VETPLVRAMQSEANRADGGFGAAGYLPAN